MQLEIEKSALKKETDNLSKDVWQICRKNLQKSDTVQCQKAQWDNEKHSVEKLQKLREQIEISINRSRKQNRTTIWKKLPSCSMANCRSFRSSWKEEKQVRRRRPQLWYMRQLQMMRSQGSFPAGRVSR